MRRTRTRHGGRVLPALLWAGIAGERAQRCAQLTRILAVPGSLRRASINVAALRACALLAPPGVEISLHEGLAALPAFNPDLDADGADVPAPVAAMRSAVAASDALLFAVPEYAHGVPGALKNLLDWLVSFPPFAGKPTALINCAPRAFHAQAGLRETLATMAAGLVPEAFATLPLAGRTWNAEEIAADGECAFLLRRTVRRLVEAAGDAQFPSADSRL